MTLSENFRTMVFHGALPRWQPSENSRVTLQIYWIKNSAICLTSLPSDSDACNSLITTASEQLIEYHCVVWIKSGALGRRYTNSCEMEFRWGVGVIMTTDSASLSWLGVEKEWMKISVLWTVVNNIRNSEVSKYSPKSLFNSLCCPPQELHILNTFINTLPK